MPLVCLAFGVVLNIVGITAYFLSEMVSITALIPALIGEFFVVLGLLSILKPSLRKHFMHVAAALGVVTFIATVGGIRKTITYMQHEVVQKLDKGQVILSNGDTTRPMAVMAQAIVAVLALIFVVICVQSFIAARRRRAQTPAA